MFSYCTRVLHLSEHEAYARITVARAARRYPELLAMLDDGRLHLSGIAKLAPHLTDANHDQVLVRATHKTKAQIEALIAEIAPKADVPDTIRKMPTRVSLQANVELGPDRVATMHEFRPDLLAPQLLAPAAPIDVPAIAPEARPPLWAEFVPPVLRHASVVPLAPARYKIEFTGSAHLRDKVMRLQALLSRDLASTIECAVTEKLERLEAKRFGLARAPRKSLDDTDTAPRSRYLPAAVRRAVHERDGAQCVFVLRNGSRCPERRDLEFHHRHPFGRGGAHDPENVCLMCPQHNGYVAELDYGKRRTAKYRRGDRVSDGYGVGGDASLAPEYASIIP